jgi:aspartate aminotransferase
LVRNAASRLDGVGISLIRRVLEAAPPGAVNLGFGEPTFETPEPIVAAARESLGQERLGYTPTAGLPELREAIANDSGHGLDADSVLVTVGSQEALFATLMAWVDVGEEVLVPDPGFPAYPAIARLAGARPVPYRSSASNGFRFDASAIEPLISARTRAIVLNNPANPTGGVIPLEELRKVEGLAIEHDLLVVSDEVYREIYFEERPPSYLDVSTEGIVVSSLSKVASMTGWRLGWAVGSPERLRPIRVVHQYAVTCAPTLSQRSALAAFDSAARQKAESFRQVLKARRDLLVALVRERLGLDPLVPEATFYLMIQAPPGADSEKTSMDLVERAGVITIPGAAFGDEAEGFLRLSFSVEEDQIHAGVERLQRAGLWEATSG